MHNYTLALDMTKYPHIIINNNNHNEADWCLLTMYNVVSELFHSLAWVFQVHFAIDCDVIVYNRWYVHVYICVGLLSLIREHM